jgi:hypothetical protein
MRKAYCRKLNIARNPEKSEKGEMYTIEPGLWQEN